MRVRLVLAAMVFSALVVSARGNASVRTDVCGVFKRDCATAQRVMGCESGGRVRIISRTNDHGLFQINVSRGAGGRMIAGEWFSTARLLTVKGNLRAAWLLYADNGYRFTSRGHWRWSHHCWG